MKKRTQFNWQLTLFTFLFFFAWEIKTTALGKSQKRNLLFKADQLKDRSLQLVIHF